MPLHPVPIIIGTTLAVISGGIAFKKFIYDPHVAPFIEAFIAAHQHPSHDARQRIPVPSSSSAPTFASTTARRDRATELRRRRRSSDHELREGLLRPLDTEYHMEEDSWGRASAYDLPVPIQPRKESPKASLPASPSRRRSGPICPYGPVVDLMDSPTSPQDAEVREVIFNQPLTPVRSTASTPAPILHANPLHPLGAVTPDIHASPSRIPITLSLPGQPHASGSTSNQPSQDLLPPESSTFSFLSLSQTSSPEINHHMLGSLTFGSATDQWAEVRSSKDHHHRVRRVIEEDVLSLPETSTSGYEDAEAYSAASGSVRSPAKIHSELNKQRAGSPSPARGLELGLNPLVEETEEGEGPGVQGLLGRRRGPMSVVSLSESEGWGGESDWEVRSQEGGQFQ